MKTPKLGDKCFIHDGDAMRNAEVSFVDEETQRYSVIIIGLGTRVSNIPFSIWRPAEVIQTMKQEDYKYFGNHDSNLNYETIRNVIQPKLYELTLQGFLEKHGFAYLLNEKALTPTHAGSHRKIEWLFEKYLAERTQELQHFKDSSVGLFATDKNPSDLLRMFWQRSSDACPLDASEAEKQEKEFAEWVSNITFKL